MGADESPVYVAKGQSEMGVVKAHKLPLANGLPAYSAHPLGPLSSQEITQSSVLIRGAWPEGTLFQFKVITLLEPAKAELTPSLQAERRGQTPTDLDRRAFVVYYLRSTVSAAPPPRQP